MIKSTTMTGGICYGSKTDGRTRAARNVCAEVLTHAAFYAGWPKAWAAFNMAKKEVWAEEAVPEDAMAAHAASMVFPSARRTMRMQPISPAKAISHRSQLRRSASTTSPLSPAAATLAHPPRENRRRADSCLRGRKRLLSGSGQARAAARPRRCCKHSARGQTLARRRTGQLVPRIWQSRFPARKRPTSGVNRSGRSISEALIVDRRFFMSKSSRCLFFRKRRYGKACKGAGVRSRTRSFEIKPVTPYTSKDLNWLDKTSRSTIEMQDKSSRPEMAETLPPARNTIPFSWASPSGGMKRRTSSRHS